MEKGAFQKRFDSNLIALILIVLIPFLLTSACKRSDHSKFKMPKIPIITGENLHSVVTQGTDDVWIAGDFGIIYYSCDNGINWERQETGTENNLTRACFIDNQNGWVCGISGTILHTSNGGKIWEQQKSNTERHLFAIYFIDSKNGWAVGDVGTVITTTDGGNTWTPATKEADVYYNDIFFSDLKHGWIVGEFGTILYTSNGGRNWKLQTCKDIEPPEEELFIMPKPTLYSVYFKDNKKGWISGIAGILLTTENGGRNWKRIQSDTTYSIYSILLHDGRGWALGAGGNYLITEDGGKTWKKKEDVIKNRFYFQGLSFRDEKDGFVVGARGLVVHTKDGGNTWEMLSGISYEMPEVKMPQS